MCTHVRGITCLCCKHTYTIYKTSNANFAKEGSSISVYKCLLYNSLCFQIGLAKVSGRIVSRSPRANCPVDVSSFDLLQNITHYHYCRLLLANFGRCEK